MLATAGIIVGIVVGVGGLSCAIYTNPPWVKVTPNAQLDVTNYLSVALATGRRAVRVTAVKPVVYFDTTGNDPGATQYVLETIPNTAIPGFEVPADGCLTVGRRLAMTEQELPRTDGNGRVIRKPITKEVRVRIDYGKNKKSFVTPTLVDYAIEPHPEPA
jgi:hypothetical protein